MSELISPRIREIPDNPIRAIFELASRESGVARMEVGEPDFNTPEHIKDAAKAALDANFTHYTSNLGNIELRETIAKKFSMENGVEYNPATEIVVIPGATAGIFSTTQALISRDDEVLIPAPSLPVTKSYIQMVNGRPVEVPLHKKDGFEIDLEVLKDLVSERTKLLILNTPNNPSGAVYNRKILEGIADLAEDFNFFVLSDEIYEKIIFDGAEHICFASLEGMKERTITLNGFSKAYSMTGWRLGYFAGPEKLMEHISKVHTLFATCANSITQTAGLAALEGPQDCVEEMRQEYERRRDVICDAFSNMGVPFIKPRGAFYIFPDFSGWESSSMKMALRLLKEAKVATVPGIGFGETGEGHLRLSFAASMKTISQAMESIEWFLSKIG